MVPCSCWSWPKGWDAARLCVPPRPPTSNHPDVQARYPLRLTTPCRLAWVAGVHTQRARQLLLASLLQRSRIGGRETGGNNITILHRDWGDSSGFASDAASRKILCQPLLAYHISGRRGASPVYRSSTPASRPTRPGLVRRQSNAPANQQPPSPWHFCTRKTR